MGQSINLIPKEVKTEQVKVQVVKASTVVAILLLLAVGGISGYFYFNNKKIEAEIKDNEDQISKLRKDIEEMADIEVVARNLDKKSASIKDILDKRIYYSMLMEETKNRVPEGVVVNEFILNKNGTISLDGVGQTYLSIRDFFANLNTPAKGTDSKFTSLFTDVTLNSVNFESRDNSARYSMTTKFSTEALKK